MLIMVSCSVIAQCYWLRRYRYGALLKDIIEGTTKELLDSGIIQSSISPFLSLIVLV